MGEWGWGELMFNKDGMPTTGTETPDQLGPEA